MDSNQSGQQANQGGQQPVNNGQQNGVRPPVYAGGVPVNPAYQQQLYRQQQAYAAYHAQQVPQQAQMAPQQMPQAASQPMMHPSAPAAHGAAPYAQQAGVQPGVGVAAGQTQKVMKTPGMKSIVVLLVLIAVVGFMAGSLYVMMTRVPVASLEVSEPVLINNQGKTLQTNVIKDSEVKEEEKEVEEEVEEVEEVSSEVDSSQKKSTRRSR